MRKRGPTSHELEQGDRGEDPEVRAIKAVNAEMKAESQSRNIKYLLIWAFVTAIGYMLSTNPLLIRFFEVRSRIVLTGYFVLFSGLLVLYGAYVGGTRPVFPAAAYSGVTGVRDDMVNQRRSRFKQLALPGYGILIGALLILVGSLF